MAFCVLLPLVFLIAIGATSFGVMFVKIARVPAPGPAEALRDPGRSLRDAGSE